MGYRDKQGWWTPFRAVIVALFSVLILSMIIPSPYVVERPGPVLNTIGDVEVQGEKKAVVSIDGADTYKTSGELNLLTVTIVGSPENPMSWFGLLMPLLDPAQAIHKRSEVFAPDQTGEQRDEANKALMTSSQDSSVAAALMQLGYDVPTKVTVGSIAQGFPAEGKLKVGDELLKLDGEPVTGAGFVQDRVNAYGSKPLTVTYKRDGAQHEVTLTPKRVTADQALLGIGILAEYDFPFKVNFVVEDIGGPSAGMMFALGITDELTPGEMTAGKRISGTGTVSDSGKVGPIGGLPQKLYAAANSDTDLFLMARGNCQDLPERIPGEMKLAAVSNLAQAEDAIKKYTIGESLSQFGCSVGK